MKILHVISTPRGEESRTLNVSWAFLDALKSKYKDLIVDEADLFKEKLPPLTAKRVDGKYILLSGKELDASLKKAWGDIIAHIERFLSADIYLISAPMWNFGIPYVLKHYIDVIIQPRYLFRYTEKGAEGLVINKKMVVVTSRGGDYSEKSPAHAFDLQEPYLKTIFGFVGVKDIIFINAQPMDALGDKVRKEKIEEAKEIAARIAKSL